MNKPKIYLDGHIDIPADRFADIAAALPHHITLTRAEPGCLRFEVTACPLVPHRLIVAEIFADQAAFEAHQARSHGTQWSRITAGIPRHYTIRTEEL